MISLPVNVSPESFSILTLSSVLRANVNIYQKTEIGASPSVEETARLETVLLCLLSPKLCSHILMMDPFEGTG